MSDGTEEKWEDLQEAVKPSDPGLTAVEEFDLGMDEVVGGIKRMMEAFPALIQENPEMKEMEEVFTDGLLPWVEKVDDDFTGIFPDMGEK